MLLVPQLLNEVHDIRVSWGLLIAGYFGTGQGVNNAR